METQHKYNKIWTKFETHALAFSLLRKNLYPHFLVRGDYKLETVRGDIVIFKAVYMKDPILKCIIQIQASDATHTKTWQDSHSVIDHYGDVPIIQIVGGEAAYNIRNIVAPYL